jgi:Glycosyl-transferase for dystroglycan
LKCFDSVRYDLYVVLRWCPSILGASVDGPVAPFYDESFRGYGKNRIQHISHLRVIGYTFAILREGFIIHSPHSKSNAKKAWESINESSLHHDMDKLYPKFLKELVSMYKHERRSIIEQC